MRSMILGACVTSCKIRGRRVRSSHSTEVTVERKSVFAASRQIWKLVVGLTLLIGGGTTSAVVTLLLGAHGAFANNEPVYDLRAASTTLALVGFAYLCTQVRCPQCRAKWIWMGASGKLNPKSLDTLATLEHCPKCGYPGSHRTGTAKR